MIFIFKSRNFHRLNDFGYWVDTVDYARFMIRNIKTIAVALSGGVDSSVACLILKRKGKLSYTIPSLYHYQYVCL